MSEEEKKFINKVNTDKAKNKIKLSMGLIIISLLTYIIPLIYGEFDFGFIFEVASLIALLVSRKYLQQYNSKKGKDYIMIAIITIAFILVYDFISLCLTNIDVIYIGFNYIIGEAFTISYLINLVSINKDLIKANNPELAKSTDNWFYEEYEEKGEKNKNV